MFNLPFYIGALALVALLVRDARGKSNWTSAYVVAASIPYLHGWASSLHLRLTVDPGQAATFRFGSFHVLTDPRVAGSLGSSFLFAGTGAVLALGLLIAASRRPDQGRLPRFLGVLVATPSIVPVWLLSRFARSTSLSAPTLYLGSMAVLLAVLGGSLRRDAGTRPHILAVQAATMLGIGLVLAVRADFLSWTTWLFTTIYPASSLVAIDDAYQTATWAAVVAALVPLVVFLRLAQLRGKLGKPSRWAFIRGSAIALVFAGIYLALGPYLYRTSEGSWSWDASFEPAEFRSASTGSKYVLYGLDRVSTPNRSVARADHAAVLALFAEHLHPAQTHFTTTRALTTLEVAVDRRVRGNALRQLVTRAMEAGAHSLRFVGRTGSNEDVQRLSPELRHYGQSSVSVGFLLPSALREAAPEDQAVSACGVVGALPARTLYAHNDADDPTTLEKLCARESACAESPPLIHLALGDDASASALGQSVSQDRPIYWARASLFLGVGLHKPTGPLAAAGSSRWAEFVVHSGSLSDLPCDGID